MAVKSKVQLLADIAGSTLAANNKAILSDMVESYEDYIPKLTTAQIAALTPIAGQLAYNTDFDQLLVYSGSQWAASLPIGTQLTKTIAISSAQILAGNTTPIKLVDAPGVGLAIIPISSVVKYNYATAAYATNTTQSIYFDTLDIEDNNLIDFGTILTETANKSAIRLVQSAVGENSIITNKALMWAIGTGNPTGGGGSLQITITYMIIAI